MKNNIKLIKLTLTEAGVNRFKKVPTFNNLLHKSQIDRLVSGENIISVNHYIFSKLQQAAGWDSDNIKFQTI